MKWLNRMTLKDGDPKTEHRPFLKPFMIVTSDDSWGYCYLGASNIKAALFVRMPSGMRFEIQHQIVEEYNRQLKAILGMPVRDQRTWCLDDFRTWLPKRKVKQCSECKQNWRDRCVWCMPMRGKELVDLDPVRLWPKGPLCDPNLLRTYLPRHLGFGPVTVGLCGISNEKVKPMVVVEGKLANGDDWKMVACTMNPGKFIDGVWQSEDPICATYYPGVGALWHLRNGPNRGMLRDWFEERGERLCDYEGLPF